MSSLTIGLISAGCIFGGALLGLVLQGLLPDYHLRDNSKDTVKVGAGMIAHCPHWSSVCSLARPKIHSTPRGRNQQRARKSSCWIAFWRTMARRPKPRASSCATLLPPGSRCSGRRKKTRDQE